MWQYNMRDPNKLYPDSVQVTRKQARFLMAYHLAMAAVLWDTYPEGATPDTIWKQIKQEFDPDSDAGKAAYIWLQTMDKLYKEMLNS